MLVKGQSHYCHIFMFHHLLPLSYNRLIIMTFNFLAHLSWKLKWVFRSPVVHSSVICLSVNFHMFILFSWTTKPISTKLGTKHPWVKRESPALFKWRATPFSKGRYLRNLKIFFSWSTGPISTLHLLHHKLWVSFNQLAQSIPGWRGFNIVQMKGGHGLSQGEIITE